MARDATTEAIDDSVARAAGELGARTGPHAGHPPRGVGASIGRYLVIGELGRGGMGVVMRAYDPKLHREVALKVVGAGTMTAEGEARLVREARAMAQINHPNVVAVYDVERVAEHGLVLAMELVDGVSLARWLEHGHRGWREVLPRLVEAGRGLAAAHRKGLLHRDFKPGNVLVEGDPREPAASGRVRVTDFGLARAADPRDGADVGAADTRDDQLGDELTRTGTVMGTPAYMAPEQHTADTLGPAADQYAFCVTLWEALAGERPFRGPTIVLDKRRGPPPWSSSSEVPAAIVRAICRGLHPRPERRFATMDDLLAALVVATTRRARWRWVGAATLGGLALGGLALAQANTERPCGGADDHLRGSWDPARRSAAQQAFGAARLPFADAAWDRAAPIVDAYARAWIDMHVDTCEASAIRREQSSAVLDLRMACLHRARADLQATTDLLVAGDAVTIEHAHELVDGLPDLSGCADVEALQGDVPPPAPERAAEVERAQTLLSAARAALLTGAYDRTLAVLNEVRPAALELAYAPLSLELESLQGQVEAYQGHYPQAEHAYRVALELGLPRPRREALVVATGLVQVATRQARYDAGLAWVTVARGLLGRARGGVLEADLLNAEAVLHVERGALAEAEACYARALQLLDDMPTRDELTIAVTLLNQARILVQRGELDRARVQVERARSIYEEALGPTHPRLAPVLCNRAVIELGTGHAELAVQLGSRALQLASPVLDPHSPALLECLIVLGAGQGELRELDAAVATYQRALTIAETALGTEHPTTALVLNNLADAELPRDLDAAERAARRALAIYERRLAPDDAVLGFPLITLGRVLVGRGRAREAVPLFERSVRVRDRDGVDQVLLAASQIELARASWAAGGDRHAARMLAAHARALFLARDDADAVAEIDAWIAEHASSPG